MAKKPNLARPFKLMWAIRHKPSGSWDGGHANLTLYWAEYEARNAIRGFSEDAADVWEPVQVRVTEL